MKIHGGSPFQSSIPVSGKSGTKKSSKSSFASHVGEMGEVSSIAPAEAVETTDPVVNSFSNASKYWKEAEERMEEATKEVVFSVIKEHFGKHQDLSEEEIEEITSVVTQSIQEDQSLLGRLENLFRQLSKPQKE